MFVDGGSGKPERDIYSLASLISWLETKPSKEAYDYTRSSSCMLALYFREMGLRWVTLGTRVMYHSIQDGKGGWHIREVDLPAFFNQIASGPRYQKGLSGNFSRDWTYGAALKRARKITERNISEPARGLLGRLAAVFGL